MTAPGLLVAGRFVDVPGVTVLPPASHGGPAWCALAPGDYRMRPTRWVRQVVLHTTKGIWPQLILTGRGPGSSDRVVAEFWRGDPAHSAAQFVVDTDGTVACLCDVAYGEAYHAEASNPWSVGIEMYQVAGGGVYQATIDATVRLVLVLCDALGIPPQIHALAYRGVPLARMETGAGVARQQLGGPDVVGIVGHRDNTSNRGRGDPGDAIYEALEVAGAEPLDFSVGQDLNVGRARQQALNARGAHLVVDGLVGPASLAAARQLGFARWRDVPAVPRGQ